LQSAYSDLEDFYDTIILPPPPRKPTVENHVRYLETHLRQPVYELPGGCFTVCDYKTVTRIPDNYHIEYDDHYYSAVYTHCGKPSIIKANLLIAYV